MVAGSSPGAAGGLQPPHSSLDLVTGWGAGGFGDVLSTPPWSRSSLSLPHGLPVTSFAHSHSLLRHREMPDAKWFGTKREEEATASLRPLRSCRPLLPLWFKDSVVGTESCMSLCPQRESFKFAKPPSQHAGVRRFSGPNDLPQYQCYCFNIMKNAVTSRAHNNLHHSSFQALQVYLVNG